jgi:hypothetical protein
MEKVMKTLILYRTTRKATDPFDNIISTIAAIPINNTPFIVTNLSLNAANFFGNQRSIAILAMIRGPSRKPVCAATNKIAASEARVIKGHL